MKIRVALLTKNEKENIAYVIEKVREAGYDDIFVVDEHSEDGTAKIAEEMGVKVFQRVKDGKGHGYRQAIDIAKESNTDMLVLPDADRTYNPKYIPAMLEFFPECDMVSAARDMKEIHWFHRFPNIFHTTLINILFNGRLKDINSGMRVVKVDKFVNKLTAEGFDIEAQIVTRALKDKLKIKEIPIDYEKREGESKIKIADGFIILWRIIKERFTK